MVDVIERFKEFLERKNRRFKIYNSSIIKEKTSVFFIIREDRERKMTILHPISGDDGLHEYFVAEENGEFRIDETSYEYHMCPCDNANASALRRLFRFTRPQVMGLTPAVGTGDRIGLATPGHIRALRKFHVFPVLAQQSIREMTRTARSPQEVIDDVSWAAFQEGYKNGFAADADHLKSQKDVEDTFGAGFTMYTIDPSNYVDDGADEYDLKTLEEKFLRFPWNEMKCKENEFLEIYLNRRFELSGKDHFLQLDFSREKLLRAATKYSFAIVHAAKLKSHLDALFEGKPYDLEVSFDETETPTSPSEHFFVASELKRLNVNVQSLAIHFVGKFEKAIDYIGDLSIFERTLQDHVLIARSCGPYKLSIHSGSDKFLIYPIIGKLAGDLFHLKTAGTTYLEALRVVARHDPFLFREIINYSLSCFEKDRKTYHITTELSLIPKPKDVRDEDLERTFLEENTGRQLLHVTFGSILTARGNDSNWIFRDRIKRILIDNEEEHYRTISTHFERYLKLLGVKHEIN